MYRDRVRAKRALLRRKATHVVVWMARSMASSRRPKQQPDPGETNIELLKKAQAYLERRRQPDVVMEAAAQQDWEQFYQVYSPVIERFARACGLPETDVHDCVQDVWSALCKDLPNLQYDPSRGKFRGWLNTLVYRKAVDLIRQRVRHTSEQLSTVVEAGREPSDSAPNAEAEYERTWKRELARTAMAHLRQVVSQNNYSVIHMRSIEGRTVEDVAAALHMTVGDVRVTHHRMKQRLRTILKRYAAEDLLPDDSHKRA
jgi:RNA polymerase sigma-70 factor (ECF subfamily)